MRCFASRAASRSTPASLYVVGVFMRRSAGFHRDEPDVVECRQVLEACNPVLDLGWRDVAQAIDAELLDRKAAQRRAIHHGAPQMGCIDDTCSRKVTHEAARKRVTGTGG